MATFKFVAGLAAISAALIGVQAQQNPRENLILCDCGIGDNKQHPTWSTSRQMDYYQKIGWPDSAYAYPAAPEMAVEVPYKDGTYPWVPKGVTATFPNGNVWTAYIQDGTPDGFKAGTAVSTKSGGGTLNCWAYRGRPVSAAINKTITNDAICWTAFVCNHDQQPPARPKDMGSKTSTLATSSSPPQTSFYSESSGSPGPTASPKPLPSQTPKTGGLSLAASVNPRFINWPNTWQAFINNFVWDKVSGRCIAQPFRGDGYSVSVDCAGVPVGSSSHMTLLLIEALRNVGLSSLWFNQNPVVPQGNSSVAANTSWVVMPQSFSLRATDSSTNAVVGYISYTTKWDNYLAGPCVSCDTKRFNAKFFDPIIAALQATYPTYTSFTVEAKCDPWLVC